MKKGKYQSRSQASLKQTKSELQAKEQIVIPLDVLKVNVSNLRTPDEDPGKYTIKVMFFDQIILNDIITSVGGREEVKKQTLARGIMSYDPSDYERMSTFADYPLMVSIQKQQRKFEVYTELEEINESYDEETKQSSTVDTTDTFYCNIDITIMFIGQDKLKVVKRMEPKNAATGLSAISWNNLPQISMEFRVIRNQINSTHHEALRQANIMKITLTGAFNMFVPFDEENVYTAVSKLPSNTKDEVNCNLVTFNQGYKFPKSFKSTSYYPKWESIRIKQGFTKCDQKYECEIENIRNDYHIDLNHYMNKAPDFYSTIWGSFHRSLMLNNAESWFTQQVLRYNWPFEIHVYNECGGYSFMTFIDLFKLLYPGETVVRLVTPLQWINSEGMMTQCGCDLLLSSMDKASSAQATIKQKNSKVTSESAPTSTSTELGFMTRATGGDDSNAFIIVEVKLARPLRKPAIPPHIRGSEIKKMLLEMENQKIKRECTGRGQLKRDFQATVKGASNALRRVPYYGMTDICAINRQLSETRNRVEIITSFWQDSAIYVNNNFVVQDFLSSNNAYEEMLMMAHACLMRTAYDVLVGVDNPNEMEPILKAARHARQLKDIPHAVDLFLQLIAERPRDANLWRELATCLKDKDEDWATVCINKAMAINPRHPLTLFSKACMVFDEDPDAAEPFFQALLSFYPFWLPMWVAANAYYSYREMFEMAHEIMQCVLKTSSAGLEEENMFPRTWEEELGDWWDHTPLLPGTSLYYEAADLLLRIRAISLAEVCIARALCESGETAAHYHLVALCCRLRGHPKDALCHLQQGITKFGDISYLRSLEGECYHKLKNTSASAASFDKAGTCFNAYSILLSLTRRDSKTMRSLLIDLNRRQPSAYAWMALADNWMTRSTGEEDEPGKSDEQSTCQSFAMACAVQALKFDRSSGRAWTLLSKLVKPNARRLYCRGMASACGYTKWNEMQVQQTISARQSLCYELGLPLRECQCKMCDVLTIN